MTKRSYFWDNYKGILILLVILGHLLYSYAEVFPGHITDHLVQFIYSFHMPAFVFCSGYLSRSVRSRSKAAITKLLLLYLFFFMAMNLFCLVAEGLRIHVLTPTNYFWYMLSLVFWRLLAEPLNRVKGIIPISLVLCLLIGFCWEFHSILSIKRTVGFFPFFLLGYRLNGAKLETLQASLTRGRRILLTAATLLFSAALVYALPKLGFTHSVYILSPYTENIHIVYRALFLLIAFGMIWFFLRIIPDRKFPLLTSFGKNSLLIYILHRISMTMFALALPPEKYSPLVLPLALAVTFLSALVFGLPALNRWVDNLFTRATGILLGTDDTCPRLTAWAPTLIALALTGYLFVNMAIVLVYGFPT